VPLAGNNFTAAGGGFGIFIPSVRVAQPTSCSGSTQSLVLQFSISGTNIANRVIPFISSAFPDGPQDRSADVGTIYVPSPFINPTPVTLGVTAQDGCTGATERWQITQVNVLVLGAR
jgi:hypothetical protein